MVNKKANKVEIRKAVEEMYGVTVDSVRTIIMPAKAKNRNTRNTIIQGRISSFKKAIVRLEEGDVIDFYGDI